MSDTETSLPEKQGSSLGIVLTCLGLIALTAVGGMFAMHDRLQASIREQSRLQENAREKLATRISDLQSSVDAISNQPKPDTESLTVLDSKITEVKTSLDALLVRLDALEKKAAEKPPESLAPAPLAPAPAPSATAAQTSPDLAELKLAILSGKPFAAELAAWSAKHTDAKKQTYALGVIAESGLASEADLNRKLRAALDDATASKKIDDTSLAGKINTHLKGLVSIKKAEQVGVYDQLRKDVLRDDIATLTRTVEALDEGARQPLEAWLSEAHARRDALDALATLDAESGR